MKPIEVLDQKTPPAPSVCQMQESDFQCLHRLKPAEFEVFKCLGEGLTPTEIADRLHVAYCTVVGRTARIRLRLGFSKNGRVRALATRFLAFAETKNFGPTHSSKELDPNSVGGHSGSGE